MAKITGLGAVFITLEERSKELMKWYEEVLELDMSEYGINFLKPNVFTLITFSDGKKGKVNLNFTVDNLDEYMVKLKKKNVEVISEIEEFNYGKFARIKDVLGNMVELWEPYNDAYKTMVLKEIENNKNK